MQNENKKCDKYENYFIFQNEEKFIEHINICDDCKKEHQKYLKVSSLIKEVSSIYLQKEIKTRMMKTVKKIAACFVVFIGITYITGYIMYNDYNYRINLEQESSISEMGLPIDEYGFLAI